MSKQPQAVERRCEPRYPLQGMILWTRTDSKQSFSCWLSDASFRSLSFVASSRRQLVLGEEVELLGKGWLRKRCRVARTSPYGCGRDLSLVACVNVDGQAGLAFEFTPA
jgi:hypothetical protein